MVKIKSIIIYKDLISTTSFNNTKKGGAVNYFRSQSINYSKGLFKHFNSFRDWGQFLNF